MEDYWTWISAYLDNELTDAEQEQFESWMSKDPAHQRLFAFQCFVVHSHLQDLFDEGRIQESLLQRVKQLVAHPPGGQASEDWTSEDLSALLLDAGVTLRGQSEPETKSTISFHRFYRRLPGLAAAALACCATLAVLTYLWTRPQVVAQVTRCVSCRWAPDQSHIVGGTELLEDQELELLEGKSQISFRSGAVLNVQGPAKLRLDDRLGCELYVGRVSAYVPAEATGFVLTSGAVKVVDRGTEFTANTLEPELIELYVHVGFVDVEVPSHSKGETIRHPTVEKRAISINRRSGEMNALPYEDSVWVSIPDKL